MSKFTNKIALVTGAASGLGKALAVELAYAGADIVAVDVDAEGLERTCAIVSDAGRRCVAKRVDVSSRAEMESLAGWVLSEWGRVDILVNNAGVGIGGELAEIPLDDFDWIVGINLMGEVYGTRLFLPGMLERRSGHIVNVSSLSGLVLLPFHLPYTTTKFALTGFSQALWAEVRHQGVGVTLVCPGAIKTNIMKNSRIYTRTAAQQGAGQKFIERIEQGGKEPEEVARMVLRAVERNRFLVLSGPEAYVLYYLTRVSPWLVRTIVAFLTKAVSREK